MFRFKDNHDPFIFSRNEHNISNYSNLSAEIMKLYSEEVNSEIRMNELILKKFSPAFSFSLFSIFFVLVFWTPVMRSMVDARYRVGDERQN